MVQVFSAVLALTIFFGSVSAQKYGTCDYKVHINHTTTSIIIDKPASTAGCRYHVLSPADTYVEAYCSISQTTSLSCSASNRQFVVSRSGELDFRDQIKYCDSGSFYQNSIGNEIAIAFQSDYSNAGNFRCKFTLVKPTIDNCDCGWDVNKKVVGGVYAKPNEFVSHAGLVNRKTGSIYCGAVIIKQKWAVTAAHCVDAEPDPTIVALLVGDHNVSTGTDTPWAAVNKVNTFIRHPNYDAATNLNDIALVETTNHIRYTLGVGPACLPYVFNGLSFHNSTLTVVGWGTTSFGGEVSKTLKKADLNVISNLKCSETMDDIDATKICTFGHKKNDSCGMDSGGGLYYIHQGRPYVIAIVNYGQYCASSSPSVNSRFDRYFGFINDYVGGFVCRK